MATGCKQQCKQDAALSSSCNNAGTVSVQLSTADGCISYIMYTNDRYISDIPEAVRRRYRNIRWKALKKVKEDIIYDHRVTSLTDATLVKYIVSAKHLRCRGRRAKRLSRVHSKIYRKCEALAILWTPREAPLMRPLNTETKGGRL